MDRTSAEQAADELSAVIESVHSGTLRIFGDWFGKPMDNHHIPRSARADGDVLIVTFNEDEQLRLTNPTEWEFSSQVFRVRRADRVAWRWFYYGRPKLPENLQTIEYWIADDGRLCASSDAKWFRPTFSTSSDSPAAELL